MPAAVRMELAGTAGNSSIRPHDGESLASQLVLDAETSPIRASGLVGGRALGIAALADASIEEDLDLRGCAHVDDGVKRLVEDVRAVGRHDAEPGSHGARLDQLAVFAAALAGHIL